MFGMEIYDLETQEKISQDFFETFDEAKKAADDANSEYVRIYVFKSQDDDGMYWDDSTVVYDL